MAFGTTRLKPGATETGGVFRDKRGGAAWGGLETVVFSRALIYTQVSATRTVAIDINIEFLSEAVRVIRLYRLRASR